MVIEVTNEEAARTTRVRAFAFTTNKFKPVMVPDALVHPVVAISAHCKVAVAAPGSVTVGLSKVFAIEPEDWQILQISMR